MSKLKTKTLGFLAVGLLAGPLAANAAYLYTFSDDRATPTASMSVVSSNFLTVTGPIDFSSQTASGLTFVSAALTVCYGPATFMFLTAAYSSLTSCSIVYDPSEATLIYSTFAAVPRATGDFTATSFGGPLSLRYLRITQTPEITETPEPGTLALLGLGLAGLGLSRRRKAN